MNRPLLARILPAALACAELYGDPPGIAGWPAEEAAISGAVESRRREYRTVRHCARTALVALGVPPAAILSGPHREPLWPPGVTGSMTHCAGYRAAAVGRLGAARAVGIDAEPHRPLPPNVLPSVALAEECALLALLAGSDPSTHWDRVLFCAKEAVYKAWFPLTGDWLGFEQASVRFDPVGGTFTARLDRPGPVVDGVRLAGFDGRWLVRDGLVLASVVLPPSRSGA